MVVPVFIAAATAGRTTIDWRATAKSRIFSFTIDVDN
jgi:hypothetical protein